MVPEPLARTIREVHGPTGDRWMTKLPALLQECGDRWGLRLEQPFAELSYHYVAPAQRADGTEAVLEVGVPTPDLLSELRAMAVLDGRGTARLLESDAALGALLIERLRPGKSLGDLPYLEAATAAAGVMRRLWRPVPPEPSFRPIGDWISQMREKAPRLLATGAGARFPVAWIRRAAELYEAIQSQPWELVLLHGDLHQGNILSDGTGWRAIDAWGMIGARAWEPGPFLFNAVSAAETESERREVLSPLIELFAARLGVEAARIRNCAVVRSVLSAFWTLEDHGCGWESEIATAEALATL